MSLTRNFLKSLSLSGEQIEAVIGAHGETVSGLRQEAAMLAQVQKELDEARQELQMLHEDPWEDKFCAVSTEFEQFRQNVTAQETRRAKEQAYRKLLQEAGVSERRLDAVVKVTDVDRLPWEDGAFVDPDGISANIKEEWAAFVGETKIHGADTARPPAGIRVERDLGKLPMREYIKKRREKR